MTVPLLLQLKSRVLQEVNNNKLLFSNFALFCYHVRIKNNILETFKLQISSKISHLVQRNWPLFIYPLVPESPIDFVPVPIVIGDLGGTGGLVGFPSDVGGIGGPECLAVGFAASRGLRWFGRSSRFRRLSSRGHGRFGRFRRLSSRGHGRFGRSSSRFCRFDTSSCSIFWQSVGFLPVPGG